MNKTISATDFDFSVPEQALKKVCPLERSLEPFRENFLDALFLNAWQFFQHKTDDGNLCVALASECCDIFSDKHFKK